MTLVVSDNTVSSLVHSLTMGVVREIVAIENKSVAPDAPSSDDLRLTKDEQEVLSYVAGYIVASLRKRYFRLQKSERQETKEAALAAIKLLNSLHSKGTDVITSNSFLEFTRKWTEIQNRGGLIVVNDAMFIFIRRIENVARSVLNTKFLRKYHSEDLRDILCVKMEGNGLISRSWNEISNSISNESLKKILKKQIIDKWVDLRINAYVRCFVQLYKRKTSKKGSEKDKISKQAEPALRKTLH